MITKYPDDNEALQSIIEYGRRMYVKDFVAANDGNISIRVSPTELWGTPTGVSKGFMTEDMMIKLDIDGNILYRGNLDITSEIKMHLRCYKENPNIISVCHAHPPAATSFAIAGIALDSPVLTEFIMLIGSVPVASYATPGTCEVPDSIAPFCKDYNAVLLANHGVLTWGTSAEQAYFRMEIVEHYAKLIMNTSYIIGKTNNLTDDQMEKLMDIRNKLFNN